jgi:hypothetical protein
MGIGVSSLEKYPKGSGPKLHTKTAKTHFGPESPALRGWSLRPWKRQKHLKPKWPYLNIRTSFLMILGLLELQQQALQINA